MEKEIILPKILIDSGLSLDKNIFRYRPDREIPNTQNEKGTGKNYILEEIRKKSLWHSSIVLLNDPFEVYAKKNINEFNLMSEVQRKLLFAKISPGKFPTNLAELRGHKDLHFEYNKNKYKLEEKVNISLNEEKDKGFKEIITNVRENIGISCFTSICDSRLMWGYYCNGLSGVCLIYNKEKLEQNRINLQQVKYIKDSHSINVLDLIYNRNEMERNKILSDIATYKHYEWSHESEHRSIVSLNKNEIGKGSIFRMKNSCLDGVIVGSNVTNSVQKIIRKKSKEFKFKLFKAEVDYSSFSVKISY
ncbi:DUF2971 domain-containing protein [Pectobacterium brasiliense]|uniref:DUF2971 domain-containing protein n=1 Tax=Pectobacterium brasiliense TaxID=180957 RepID=UPI00057FB236|nr:DUF2971 domain-containing protein [Pectobacterium brasiliense]